ncbi:MAG: hypothetical protein Q8N18_05185 [Opitutaceae bacterium]|nr:hypothetical protein [Opitutaceae bacterium]
MSLKPQLDKPPVPVSAPPAWGELAEPGEPVSVIRFECEDGAYSYPYHALSRWVLQAGQPECLVVQVGKDRLTVRGRDLNVVRDALDAGRLRVLRPAKARYDAVQRGTIVAQIEVELSTHEK